MAHLWVHEAPPRPTRRAPRPRLAVGLLLLAFPVVDASARSAEGVASKHIGVARKMAEDGVDLSSDYGKLAAAIWDHDCQLPREAEPSQAASVRRFVELYSRKYCESWMSFWHEGLSPCGTRFSPLWCDFDTDVASRIDLVGYLSTLVSGLEQASGLERANIVAMTFRTLNARPVFEAFPLSLLETWAGKAAAGYLRNVEPERAVMLAETIHPYWFRTAPAVRQAFAAYTDVSPAISESQRAAIEHALADDPQP